MQPMSKTLAERVEALEKWADRVAPEELRDADPEATRQILELLEGSPDADEATAAAQHSA